MVLNNYAYFLALEERDLERALRMAERAVEHSANNPTFLDTQAWILHPWAARPTRGAPCSSPYRSTAAAAPS